MTLRVSRGLPVSCGKAPERTAWLDRLPNTLQRLQRQWSLTLHAPLDSREGTCSYVVAVLRADWTPAVLKVGMPHMEGEDEIHGLRFWNGNPTVQLLQRRLADTGSSDRAVTYICELPMAASLVKIQLTAAFGA